MNSYNYTQRRRRSNESPASSDSQPRSRTIAIQRNRGAAGDYENAADAAVYEMATWRMYNRIVTHRTMMMMQQQGQDGASSSDEETFLTAGGGYRHLERTASRESISGSNSRTRSTRTTSPLTDDEDEGIFQFDM
jgi:hypothetical protein